MMPEWKSTFGYSLCLMKYSSASAIRSSSSAMSSSGLRPVTPNTSSATFLMIVARVEVLVYAVAEPHQPIFATLHPLYVRRDVVRRPDLSQHAQHLLVRTPCSGPYS